MGHDRVDVTSLVGVTPDPSGRTRRTLIHDHRQALGPALADKLDHLLPEGGDCPYIGPELDQLEPYLNEAIADWAETAFNVASVSCSHDQVDRVSCSWYHGAWPTLRALDVVSSPAWHRDFYSENLYRVIRETANPRVLISGTADFSMLAFVLAAAKGIAPQPKVHVIDNCRTPLEACEWYSARVGGRVCVHQRSVLDSRGTLLLLAGDRGAEPFDLIATDALLTRFRNHETERVVTGWFGALRPGGTVVTTVRLHPREVGQDPSSNAVRWVDRVAELARLRNSPSKITEQELVAAAKVYAEKITSYNLGDATEVVSLFVQAGFALERHEVASVKGEFAPAEYIRVVARKPCELLGLQLS